MRTFNKFIHKKLMAAIISTMITIPITVIAATEADKRQAIDDGLAYLAGIQQVDGHWEQGDVYSDTAATGAVLLSFLEEKDNWGANAAAYSTIVSNGLNYVLNQAQTYNIGVQPAGNPDSAGNGIGVKFVLGGDNNRDTYVSGIVATALTKVDNPNAVITTGMLGSRTDGSGAGGAWTYTDVVQNTMDYFAYGQEDPAAGTARGGWRYYANSGSSDNSTAQWPAVTGLFAEGTMGISTPEFVKDELAYWIEYIQNPVSGGSGYNSPTYIVNVSKTGGLLTEMAFAGDDTTGVTYNTAHGDVQAALGYLNANWQTTANGTWYGNFNHPYAMWSTYKGLETMIGLDDTTWIINLRDQTTLGAVIDAGDTWNWWEDYNESLVSGQNANGSWSGYSYWSGALATAWNINILAGTHAETPPANVPEPAPLALMGAGLFAFLARRWRKTV